MNRNYDNFYKKKWGGSSGLWYICPDLPREPESNFGNKAESSNLYFYKTILILLYNSYKL